MNSSHATPFTHWLLQSLATLGNYNGHLSEL